MDINIDGLQQLSNNFGDGVKYLIEAYAQRAKYEFITPVFTAVGAAFSLAASRAAAKRRETAKRTADSDAASAYELISGVFMIISITLVCITLGTSIYAARAYLAPEAYAVDLILDKIGNNN